MNVSDLTHIRDSQDDRNVWTNWVGNQSFVPRDIASPESEAALINMIRSATADGSGIRAFGSGHSFTPIVETSGTLLDLDAFRGIISIDAGRKLVGGWAN